MVARRNISLEAQASTYRHTINLLCINLIYILMFTIYPVPQLLFPKRKKSNCLLYRETRPGQARNFHSDSVLNKQAYYAFTGRRYIKIYKHVLSNMYLLIG